MLLLQHQNILRKIKRLAYQILEQNYNEKAIILAGINQNGTAFAKLILNELSKQSKQEVTLTQIKLNPANPLSEPIQVDRELDFFIGKNIIIVDDVANTGRTIFYALRAFMDIIPSKIEVAVLIDRKHKSFPIMVDYVGMSLATTLQENILVDLNNNKDFNVLLN